MVKHYILGLLLLLSVWDLSAGESIKVVLFPFRETVIASRVESQIGKYFFRLGEAFPANAVLTELESENYRIKLQLAKDQFAFAKAAYEDKQELRKGNFTSDFELKKAEYEYRTAQSNLAVAQLNFSHCSIKAPFSGKIVEIITREHETVRPGQQLLRIIDDHSLLAVMNIPLQKIQPVGSKMTIRLQTGKKVQGTVYEVSPQADHRTGTVRIRVLVDNKNGELRAGMIGELDHGK